MARHLQDSFAAHPLVVLSVLAVLDVETDRLACDRDRGDVRRMGHAHVGAPPPGDANERPAVLIAASLAALTERDLVGRACLRIDDRGQQQHPGRHDALALLGVGDGPQACRAVEDLGGGVDAVDARPANDRRSHDREFSARPPGTGIGVTWDFYLRRMDTEIPVRHIECDGVFNVRDLGGYETIDGRRVRWGQVFRADGLHRAASTPGGPIDALGWRTVLDLRTLAEVELGAFRHDGVEVVHLPVLRQTWEGRGFEPDAEPVAFLVARYLEMLEEGAAAIAGAVEILASRDRLPAVFHCSAGKDRTGVLAALLLTTLGVDEADVAADYHLSASAMEALMAWFTATQPDLVDLMAQQPRQFLACPPEAMLETLEHVRNRHGSAAGYLVDAGVSRSTISELRTLLLED